MCHDKDYGQKERYCHYEFSGISLSYHDRDSFPSDKPVTLNVDHIRHGRSDKDHTKGKEELYCKGEILLNRGEGLHILIGKPYEKFEPEREDNEIAEKRSAHKEDGGGHHKGNYIFFFFLYFGISTNLSLIFID